LKAGASLPRIGRALETDMPVTSDQTIKEVVSTSLAALRILQDHQLDFCKGSGRTLAEACAESGIPLADLLAELNQSATATETAPVDWNNEPLPRLVAHIIETHHEYLRSELPRLSSWMERVVVNHGPKNPEMFGVLNESLATLSNELLTHLHREEAILFPAIARYQKAVDSGVPLPAMPFGSVANPIGVMEGDHDKTLRVLELMREAASGYQIPADACTGYRSLFLGLNELEENLRRHIFLENEILFPRARRLEIALSPKS
jgi:regulator of cell morphogenesis and NO signaling